MIELFERLARLTIEELGWLIALATSLSTLLVIIGGVRSTAGAVVISAALSVIVQVAYACLKGRR